MVTDKQFQDLVAKFNELSSKYTRMSQDIATIKMTLDIAKSRRQATPAQTHKDVTKYLFLDKQLNKRQLVLECVKQFISDTGTTDPKALFEFFPDHIQGSLGVLRAVEEAERYSGAPERFFFGDEEVLNLDGGIYVVSKDWTINNINKFIDVMETLGYDIKTISRY